MKPFDRGKLAGGYVPRPLAEHLGVAALYHHTSRSHIFRELITQYLETLPPLEEMLRHIADEEFGRWDLLDQDQKPTYKEFRDWVREGLSAKRIGSKCSQQLIQYMDELHESSKGRKPASKKADKKERGSKTA
jgi:hypothetical protein